MATKVPLKMEFSSKWFCSSSESKARTRINHKRIHVARACHVHSNSTPNFCLPSPLAPPLQQLVFSIGRNALNKSGEGDAAAAAAAAAAGCSNVMRRSAELETVTSLIDVLQKSAMDHHFSHDIDTLLNSIYENYSQIHNLAGCGNAALSFRLLRQGGYSVSSDFLYRFLDGKGEFPQELKEDTEGLIHLYEASFLNTGGEHILHKAQEFSRKHLVSSLPRLDPHLATRVRQTLELPYHMTLQRYKTRQYLDQQQHGDIGTWQSVVKQLARSDFMQLQTLHRNELNEITRWWRKSGLAQDLWFARDQHLKWYVWSVAIIPDARFSKYRILITKVIAFIYLIDDIYDVHGSTDELNLFTEAIQKWDLSVIDSLPTYMKICYTALHAITNEVAEMVMKEHGWEPTISLAKSWQELCNAFWLERKWFASKHVPVTDVYLRNGITSSGTLVVFVHLFFLMEQGITNDSVQLIESNPKLLSSPAAILRLCDDLGSAKDENQEGFDGSYLECYKKENPHCTEQDAREVVEMKIAKAWEELNKECLSSSSPFSKAFRTACLNLARMVKVMYTYTDDQKLPMLDDCVNSLLFQSVI